jgi:hypothetical protein
VGLANEARRHNGGELAPSPPSVCTSPPFSNGCARHQLSSGDSRASERTTLDVLRAQAARAPAFLSDANALLSIGRRSPRAEVAGAGWKCL